MRPRPFAHRPAAPRCRGGASSLLRLSTAPSSRWPSATALGDWIGHLARQAPIGADAAPAPRQACGAASQWFTRLGPTAA